jgi:hypothetical protein
MATKPTRPTWRLQRAELAERRAPKGEVSLMAADSLQGKRILERGFPDAKLGLRYSRDPAALRRASIPY